MSSARPVEYGLFGAAPDTSNRGVSALFRSVVEGVGQTLPDSKMLVFDNGSGFRSESTVLGSGSDYGFTRVGARGGRRYYAPENLATMAAFSSLGRVAGKLHPVIRALDRCGAILDVSGGDSFSDIYGSQRFWNIVRPKLIANRRRVPLILLPQTYGPFRSERKRRVATDAILGARMAWARDPRSFEALKGLMGNRFDASRHKEGVDLAFNLQPVDPGDKIPAEILEWVRAKSEHLLVGINVSGLVALDPEQGQRRFGLRAGYLDSLVAFIQSLLRRGEVRLLLVPHVMAPPGSPESDAEASRRLMDRLQPDLRSRVRVTPRELDEREVKWLISKLDWFCGTRMHSTIAALSSGVPTVAVAYSDKTRGVFESCRVGDEVIDPRRLTTQDVIEQLSESFERRAQTAMTLSTAVPNVKARAAEQFQEIAAALRGSG